MFRNLTLTVACLFVCSHQLFCAQVLEEKKEAHHKATAIDNPLDQALAWANALQKTMDKKHHTQLGTMIAQWKQAKNLPAGQRNQVLYATNRAVYKLWHALPSYWGTHIVDILSMKRSLMCALVQGTPKANTEYIKVFHKNLTKYNVDNQGAALYIENSLYAVTTAQAAITDEALQKALNSLATYLANLPQVGAKALKNELWEAHRKLQVHKEKVRTLGSDPLANWFYFFCWHMPAVKK